MDLERNAVFRVQRAVALLQATEFTWATISEVVGSGNNRYALSNFMVKLTGKRPSDYRRWKTPAAR
jgi:YesN/AraC family two-component response regulator